MAVNTYNNAVSITKMAMDCLRNNLTFSKFVNRQYDDQFQLSGAKNGDTANIRIPGNYKVRQGNVADPQGYNDTFVPVKLNQSGVDVAFTTKDLRLSVEDGAAFKQNVLNPMMSALASSIDLAGCNLVTTLNQATGTPGTAPTGVQSFLNAGAVLKDSAVPMDDEWSAILSPWTEASVVNGLTTIFNPSKDISEQYRNGTMGRAVGFKWSMDQNMPTQTFGPLGGSPTVTSAPADGATTLVTTGWTAAAALRLNAGDVFTVAGVFKVNPVTKNITTQLAQFVVTAPFSSDSSGNGSISFSPAMSLAGPLQNINALPIAGAAITPLSAASKVSPTNAVFHRDCFGLVSADLGKYGDNCVRVKDPGLNISMRCYEWLNGSTDTMLWRFDVLTGWAALRPTFGCRVQG